MLKFIEPFDDADMIYDLKDHRYILTEAFVESRGTNLDLLLQTIRLSNPNMAVEHTLDRVSRLVYQSIYSFGRTKETKQYLLACNPELRDVIRDAMYERLQYMLTSGDLSTQAAIIIQDGILLSQYDKIPSVLEQEILISSGILHRGKWQIIKDEKLVY